MSSDKPTTQAHEHTHYSQYLVQATNTSF